MTVKSTLLTEDERTMLHALAIRLQTKTSEIYNIAKETGGNEYKSATYNNAQEIRTAIDRIIKCDENRYPHTVPDVGGVRYGGKDD